MASVAPFVGVPFTDSHTPAQLTALQALCCEVRGSVVCPCARGSVAVGPRARPAVLGAFAQGVCLLAPVRARAACGALRTRLLRRRRQF